MDWKELVNQVVLWVLYLLLGIVAGIVGKAVTAWLNARKEAEEADKALSEESDKSLFMSFVDDLINDAVNAVGQTLVAGLKGTSAWTSDVKANCLLEAKRQVTLALGEVGAARLENWIGDVEQWLTTKIEAAVLKNKGKWAASSAYNTFKEKMEKLVSDVKSEPGDASLGHPDPVGAPGEPGVDGVEISDAAYEAATYEGTV